MLLRRLYTNLKKAHYSNVWPIDEKASRIPEGWTGWPDGKKFALVLTHDVEGSRGHSKCHELIRLEKTLGFISSFNFVSEKYKVSKELREYIVEQGFEVGVHGLYHDGKLYNSREIFLERALKINRYLKEWDSVGFRSPSMQHNLEWIHDLSIEYDSSTFDTDPFEPQSDGVGTIFPFYVKGDSKQKGYIELPYTLPQDGTLFIFMKESGINVWKNKLNWIAEKGGMVLLDTHPDYMNFDNKKALIDEYPSQHYKKFLEYIKHTYAGQYWNVLPREMARFWRSIMKID